MKNILLTISAVCFYLFSFSQNEGIHFEEGVSWQQVLAKAKKENKFIFVDCYTTWCGPCKFMAKNIFPLKETGDAVNSHFISVGIQIDSTDHDSDTVKRAYPDAHLISINYNIRAYPTFLYLSPEGKLVHRTVGSTRNAAEFIINTKDAMNPDRQYYAMIEKFRSGGRDTVMLESLINLAIQNENGFLADSVIRAWLPLIKNVYTTDRLQMITQIAIEPGTPEFDLFYHNAEKINSLFKPGYAENVVMNAVIQHNQSILTAFNDPASTPDWNKISMEISNQYGPALAHRIVMSVKPVYYKRNKNWDLYIKNLLSFLKEYETKLDAIDLNNASWDIFQYSTSSDDLNYGLSLSERSVNSEKNNPAFIDTYANLLYKLGRKTEAIAKETEAMNLTEPSERPSYQETLDKMKSGAKTWD
ncbi:MAG TPA: thioredoxin domain-containing protein [Puia sp.]|nr:thioredoxin domain-containing protein [Puia sp.]